MKAFLTTIGERTTELCAWQLSRLGFDVVLLDAKESWFEKYQRFIRLAQDNDCIRVDADVIVNAHFAQIIKLHETFTRVLEGTELAIWMMQFHTYDFYKNDLSISSPIYYHHEALTIIANNLAALDPNRPEASAWRLHEINSGHNSTSTIVAGIHGFWQDEDTVERAHQNKINRKQDDQYDWAWVAKVQTLL